LDQKPKTLIEAAKLAVNKASRVVQKPSGWKLNATNGKKLPQHSIPATAHNDKKE